MSATNPQKIKIAAYCRVSTDKEDQISSLKAQKDFFEEYAKMHSYNLVELYADEGISGTKLKNRRAFNKMMEDAANGEFQQVFVKDISRFARNAVDFLNSIRELKSMGIKCDFVNSNLSTEDGEFTLGILALVAQEESANLSKRVRFGKIKNAEKGKVPNFVYGYDKICGNLFDLDINSEEAPIVKKIFELYTIEGYGANKIAQILNADGLKTKRACRWSQNAVSRILTNPIYIGMITNGKEEVEDFLTGVRIKKDKKNWMVNTLPKIAIIDENTFAKAQQIMTERKKDFNLSGKRESGKFIFSTLLKCEDCGYSFRRIHKQTGSKSYTKWVCSGRNANGKDFCENHSIIDEKELYDSICKYIINEIGDEKKFVEAIRTEIIREYKKAQKSVDKNELTKKLIRLKKAKAKQTEMYEIDAISIEELRKRTNDLNLDIEKCSNAIKNFRNDGMCNEKTLDKSCENIKRILTPENMDNHLLKQIITKISVKNNGKMTVYFS